MPTSSQGVSSTNWRPLLLLPNVNLSHPIECVHVAIVGHTDRRYSQIRTARKNLKRFLDRFSDQFGNKRLPALLVVNDRAPPTCSTYDAQNAFRNLLSASVVPIARCRRLKRHREPSLAFANSFRFYPLMVHEDTAIVKSINHASYDFHLLPKFSGQTFPEQLPVHIKTTDIDAPLLGALLEKWSDLYASGVATRENVKLFRSLNMANEASEIPTPAASTIYDVGRTLALWVSALEILTHPGGTGKANFGTVVGMIERVNWRNPSLASRVHSVTYKGATEDRPLASWIYKKVYDLRNDYFHGNDVSENQLFLRDGAVIDFAACLFRLALTGFLDVRFTEPEPPATNVLELAQFRHRQKRFYHPQGLIERAIAKAI